MNLPIEQSIDKIVKDSTFFESLETFFNPNEPSEAKIKEAEKKAAIFMYHLVDYYVTIKMTNVDIAADLFRLCNDKPSKAKRLINEINKAAMMMKMNYQYLCNNRANDNPYIFPQFFLYGYGYYILKYLGKEAPLEWDFPYFDISLNELELFSSNDNKDVLLAKSYAPTFIQLKEDNIKEFIQDLFSWADLMSDALSRMKSDQTILEFDTMKISKLHYFCNDKAYYSTDAESFADAIMGLKKPSFKIKNKDFFYEILSALYESAGPLAPRNSWLKSVLSNFELEISDFSSHVNKVSKGIKNGVEGKSINRYKQINEILQ